MMTSGRLVSACFALSVCACTATQDLGTTDGKNPSGGAAGTRPGPQLQVRQVRQHRKFGAPDGPVLVSVTLTAPTTGDPIAIEPKYTYLRTGTGRIVRGATVLDEDRRAWVDGIQTSEAGEAIAPGKTFGPWVVSFEFDAYSDPPLTLSYKGPNNETSETDVVLEKGTECRQTVGASFIHCDPLKAFALDVTTYMDRDLMFCGSCSAGDVGALSTYIIESTTFPSGLRVDPTQSYELGPVVTTATTRCGGGLQTCRKASDTLCPSKSLWADLDCGGAPVPTLHIEGMECADLKTNTQHCGGCNKPCGKGQSCSIGVCK